jgi:aconitate hydratase
MAQKILAARAADPSLAGDMVQVKVDQIVLARAPARAFGEAVAAGLKKTTAEVAIAYDGACVTDADRASDGEAAPLAMLAHGVLVARPGIGYANAVHLERFASPARLCVTDEPRLAGVGGIGMLPFVVPPGLLGQALAQGTVLVRPPRSVQVLLTGRLRPFVCARDVALELLRRGLGEVVCRVEEEKEAPVVVEFAGPSARLLSVAERSVLAAIAPQLGAAGALFVSDERTEVFLRDQRRSKAHRALVADAGAPCDDVVNVDLGAVDPLLLDAEGQVRAVRDLAGKPVAQVIFGGDSGATLRDLFAAATLLRSKRVPPRLDLLLAIPSRQMLEVLSTAGALTDLIAAGARLVEPDARIVTGDLYPPPSDVRGVGLRTFDPEPRVPGRPQAMVASAETLAYAVATGEIGDPRSFKRPVRVTVPRALPTDDVLVVRERRAADLAAAKKEKATAPKSPFAAPWRTAQTLEIVEGAAFAEHGMNGSAGGIAVVCATLDEVRQLAARAADVAGTVRAVMAPFIPSGLVALFSGLGIAAIRVEAASARGLKGQKTIALPPPSQWAERQATAVALGASKLSLKWLALGTERAWAGAGTARPAQRPAR